MMKWNENEWYSLALCVGGRQAGGGERGEGGRVGGLPAVGRDNQLKAKGTSWDRLSDLDYTWRF